MIYDANTPIEEFYGIHQTPEQKRIAALEARVAQLEARRVKPFRVLANTELARGLVTLANRVGMPHRYDPKYKDVVFGCEDGWNWGEDYE